MRRYALIRQTCEAATSFSPTTECRTLGRACGQCAKNAMKKAIRKLPPFEPDEKLLNVIVETPKGSRNKYAFDEEIGLFKLRKILPEGMSFPFDFGFVPQTRAEDGDPIDVLLLMEEKAFPGCLVESRLVGVIRAE